MIRDAVRDVQTVAAYIAAAQILAAVVLCIIGRTDAPPVRHASRGAHPVSVDVVTVPRAPDEWPADPSEFIPTRPMMFRPPRPAPLAPFPEPPAWQVPS